MIEKFENKNNKCCKKEQLDFQNTLKLPYIGKPSI